LNKSANLLLKRSNTLLWLTRARVYLLMTHQIGEPACHDRFPRAGARAALMAVSVGEQWFCLIIMGLGKFLQQSLHADFFRAKD